MKKFAETFRELRQERNIRQEQLAKELGVSKGIISMWKNGLRDFNMESLIALANYFDISIDELVGRKQ